MIFHAVTLRGGQRCNAPSASVFMFVSGTNNASVKEAPHGRIWWMPFFVLVVVSAYIQLTP